MPQTVTQDDVFEALKTAYDPEIPANVVDLGLIYEVQVNDDNNVYVQLTLTFPGCGMGPHIAQQAEWAIQDVEGVEEVEIELVFDPPWTPDLFSPGARSQLGIRFSLARRVVGDDWARRFGGRAGQRRSNGYAPGECQAGADQAQLETETPDHRSPIQDQNQN